MPLYAEKQVGGNVRSFFRQIYSEEIVKNPINLRWSKDYGTWLKSGIDGDILVGTETWPCLKDLHFQSSGVRQLSYHLTIQDNRLTYDVSHHYIPKADPYACGVVVHTGFMARKFLKVSHNAVLMPYVSPHIHALAASRS
eukprot:gene22498-1333_t